MEKRDTVLQKNHYDNLKLLSPCGQLICFLDQRKLSFYKRKNLVIEIEPQVYQLTFTPKGFGVSEVGDTGFSKAKTPRNNVSVISGIETDLTRHHIVPTFFRKHFTDLKKHNSQLVVLISRQEHDKYNAAELSFYNELAKIYNVKTESELTKEYVKEFTFIRRLRAYYLFPKPFQTEKKELIIKTFIEKTGLDATDKNIENFLNTPTSFYHPEGKVRYKNPLKKPKLYSQTDSEYDFGKLLASKVSDVQGFEKLYFDFFVKTTKPKFLPEDLKVKFNLL